MQIPQCIGWSVGLLGGRPILWTTLTRCIQDGGSTPPGSTSYLLVMRISESRIRQIVRETVQQNEIGLLKVLSCRADPAPNKWGDKNLVYFQVDLGLLESFPTGKIPGFSVSLLRAIPTLASHGCSYGSPGGFVKRMTENEGTWMGHVMEHVALELQCLRGHEVSFGRTRSAGQKGVYDIWFECQEEKAAIQAGWDSRNLLLKLIKSCIDS